MEASTRPILKQKQHNHALLAERTTILQNQAQETTANLRPNPTLSGDAQFLPFFRAGKSQLELHR